MFKMKKLHKCIAIGLGSTSQYALAAELPQFHYETAQPLIAMAVARPDLVVTSVVGPKTGAVGKGMNGIKVTVKNQGTAASKVQVPSGILMSKDRTLTLTDTSTQIDCQHPPLAVGKSHTCTVPFAVTVPTSLKAGSYYLGAYVDPRNEVSETNESNNGRVSSSAITLTGGSTGKPDLVVTSVVGPSEAVIGEMMNGQSIAVTVKNKGSVATTADTYAIVVVSYERTISLREDPLIEGFECYIGILAAGESYDCEMYDLSIPEAGGVDDGEYYLGAYVDPDNAVLESNEKNNALAASAPIMLSSSGSSTPETQVYNVANDFSTSNNPNGVWSYGWTYSYSEGEEFHLYQSRVDTGGILAWIAEYVDDGKGGVEYNYKSSPVTLGTQTWEPYTVSIHNGTEGREGVVRFTAPSDATCIAEGSFYAGDVNASTAVKIVTKRDGYSDLIFSEQRVGSETKQFNLSSMFMGAGETIDFIVGGEQYGFGDTGLAVEITCEEE